MKLRWALLTLAAALVLGVGAGLGFGNLLRPTIQIALTCVFLQEAEKAGYLDKQKRNAVIDGASAAKSLDAGQRQSILSLRSACPA